MPLAARLVEWKGQLEVRQCGPARDTGGRNDQERGGEGHRGARPNSICGVEGSFMCATSHKYTKWGKGEAIRENSTLKLKTHKGKIHEATLHCEMSFSKGLKQEM